MRIISGIHGGRRTARRQKCRTQDPQQILPKKACLTFLQNNLEIDELKVLDLFGGTGCISYELASRAPDITIVEKDDKMYDFIKKDFGRTGV